jgi:alpha-beta hydrolase superfamily lysophospholipase
MEQHSFTDSHGVSVLTRSWPVATPAGVIVICHGASEHSGRYDRFARALNDAGFSVASLDNRGHGGTEPLGPTAVVGPGGSAALVEDLHEVRQQASEAAGADVPMHLLGHSLGSLIALAYLVQHGEGLASAVLSGFPADIGEVEAFGELLHGVVEVTGRDEPVGDLTGGAASAEGARTPYDWLSRDDAEVDAYLADPMCGDQHPLTYGYLVDVFELVAPASELLDEIAVPVLVMAGDQDPTGSMGAYPTGLAAALRAAGVPVDLTLYEDARHEPLNELNRDEVTADVIAWFQAR